MTVKRLHGIVGFVTVLVFLGTGMYMRMTFPELYDGNQVIRYLFRANHVYILFAGLLNVLPGLYLSWSIIPWRRSLQRIGSWMILIGPLLFLVAFIIEPVQASPMRPQTVTAAFVSLMGVTLHGIAVVIRRRTQSAEARNEQEGNRP